MALLALIRSLGFVGVPLALCATACALSTAPIVGEGSGGSGGTGTGGTGTGATSSCTGYEDEPPATIQVRLTNKMSTPIVLGPSETTCGPSLLFSVTDSSGTAYVAPNSCGGTCAQQLAGKPAGCVDICLYSSTVTLASGESHTVSFDALKAVPVVLPSACSFGIPEGWSCDKLVQIPSDQYLFSASAGVAPDCSQTGSGSCGACVPSPNGGCATDGAIVQHVYSATATVVLGPEHGLGVDPGGGVGGALPVDLVFSAPPPL